MKRIFIMILSSALLLAGCAKEIDSQKGLDGDVQEVTFTASIPTQSTKATADEDGAAASVNHWVVEVRDSDGGVYTHKDEDGTAGDKTHKFTVKLVRSQTYTVLFWADTKGTYNTEDLTNVKLLDAETAGYVANKDSRDAFSGVVSNFKSSGASSQNITLHRPFGQLNIIFTDLAELYSLIGSDTEYAKFKPCSLKVTAKVPKSFNVQTQTAGDAATTALNLTAAKDYLDNYDSHGSEETIFMDYFFATAGSKDVIDLGFSFVSKNVEISHSFNSVPFQRNYRTNVKGELMTSGSTWNVNVDPTWEEPEIDVKYASTLAQAQEIVGTASDDAIVVEVKQEAVTNATEDDVVTVGGKKYLQFILKTTSPLYVGFELPEITNTDYERLGADTWLVTYEPTYPTTDVTVDAPESTKVKIEAPTSHVEVTGTTYTEITASTGDSTLVVPSGISVSNLIINKGGLEIHGTVAAASVDTTGGKGPVYVRACENLIKTVYDNLEPYIDVDNGYVGEKVADNNYRIYLKKEKVAKIGDVEYYTLNAAVNAATAGQTIELINDVPMPYSNVYLRFKDNVTLDLKDYTITSGVIDADGDYDYEDGYAYVFEGKGITIKNGKILGVANGVEGYCYGLYIGNEEDGNIATSNVTVQDIVFPKGGMNVYNSTGVTVKDCDVTVQPTSYYAVYVCGDGAGASVAIDGGTYRAGANGYVVCTEETPYEGSVAAMTISAGTFTGGYSVEKGGSLSITGGTYSVDPTTYVAEDYEAIKTGDVWVVSAMEPVAKIKETGGTYTTLAKAFSAVQDGRTIELLKNCSLTASTTIDKNITLSLGTYTLTNACSGYAFNLNTTETGKTFKITGTDASNCGHIVSNGTSGHSGIACINANSAAVTFEMDYVKVHGATENDAYVGTANSNSEALINDYTSASDVINLTDCTIKTTSVILGGNQTHSAAASLNISGGSYTGAKGFRYAGTEKSVIDGATITVDQGIALYPYSDTDLKDSFVYDNATGNLNHDAISVGGDGSDLVITNTTVESVSKTAVATENLGKATIESGTFSSTCTSNYGAALRCDTSGGTIVVNGGTIDGSKALYAVFSNTKLSDYPNAVSTITINGGTIKGGSSDMGFVSGGKAYVEINGGTFTTAVKLFEGNTQWVRINTGCTATFNEKVTGMTGTASVAIPAGTFKKAIENGDFTAGASISGGLFYEAAPYSSYIVDGYMAVQNEGTPATWSIKKQPGVGLGSVDKGDQEDW